MFMFENNKTKWSEVYPMLEEKGDKEKYDKFFRAALKKFGVNSPADLPADLPAAVHRTCSVVCFFWLLLFDCPNHQLTYFTDTPL